MTTKPIFVGRKAELKQFEKVLRSPKSHPMLDTAHTMAKKHARRDP